MIDGSRKILMTWKMVCKGLEACTVSKIVVPTARPTPRRRLKMWTHAVLFYDLVLTLASRAIEVHLLIRRIPYTACFHIHTQRKMTVAHARV
jgi:hypothetical protein